MHKDLVQNAKCLQVHQAETRTLCLLICELEMPACPLYIHGLVVARGWCKKGVLGGRGVWGGGGRGRGRRGGGNHRPGPGRCTIESGRRLY